MGLIQTDYSQYVHTYEAYRLSKDSIPKTASHSDLVKNGTDSTNLILTESSRDQMIADRLAYGEQLKQQLDAECEESNAEVEKKAREDELKAMTVFRELSNGKKVPSFDENQLMQYNANLYKVAKMSQMMAQLAAEDKEQDVEDTLWDKEDREAPSRGMTASEYAAEFEKKWGDFMKAQADSVIEVSTVDIDVSAITSFASMGSGVYQAIYDTII